MSQPESAFSNSRQATRAPVDLAVRLQLDEQGPPLSARCDNVSIGGMFAITEKIVETGRQIRFELDVHDQETVRGLAEVVWCQPASELRPAGVGFKFRYLEQRDRQLIFKLVSQHIKERLAARAPAPTPRPAGPPPTILSPGEKPSGPPAFAVVGDESAPTADPASDVAPAAETTASDAAEPALETESPFTFQPASSGGSGASPPGQQALELTPPPAPPAPPSSFEASFEEPARADQSGADLGGGGAELGFDTAEKSGGPSLLDDSLGDSLFGQAPGGDASFDQAAFEPPAAVPGAAAGQTAASGDSTPRPEPLGFAPPAEAGRADSSYVRHLGDDHFEHRPQPKRERSLLILGGLVLLLVAALGYLFGDRIFELGVGGPATATGPPPPTAAPAAEEPALKTLEDLSFRRDGDIVEIIATANGTFGEGSFDSFSLGGEKPRHVVRLYGFERGEKPTMAVGQAGVSQVRTGWHEPDDGPPQIHLVVDLDDPRTRIVELRADGRRVIIRLAAG